MDENIDKQNRSDQLRTTLLNWLVYLKQTFSYAFSVALLVGVSFLFTSNFSAKTYSDRLFIVGIFITMAGVFLFITIAGTRKNMGLPTIAKSKEDARKIMDRTPELIEKAEKRYDAGAQVWAVGIACMVLSILSTFLLDIFKF